MLLLLDLIVALYPCLAVSTLLPLPLPVSHPSARAHSTGFRVINGIAAAGGCVQAGLGGRATEAVGDLAAPFVVAAAMLNAATTTPQGGGVGGGGASSSPSRALVGLGDQDKMGAWNEQDSMNKRTLPLALLCLGCPPPFRAVVLNITAAVVFRAGGHVRLLKDSLHHVLLRSRPQAGK